ncbi:hypothetical protein AQUCO_03500051v1 [Aquilegia coerulea]|uniref:Uncharacterized protein n=1 Tax=Aquilegia coerulea TaxID=218851 RepID=A0A2G5CVW4_AQUCA|nr:hypothetical protein AQUCO_03500051v1 [Aquilegia coerulea]
MGSLSGILQRPLTLAAAAIAVAISELPDRLLPVKILERSLCLEQPNIKPCPTSEPESKSWVSFISASRLTDFSFETKFRVPVPNIKNFAPTSNLYSNRNPLFGSLSLSLASHPAFLTLYQSAELAKAPTLNDPTHFIPSPPSEVMYRWHLPEPSAYKASGDSECSSAKSRTVVVLLGWLGAKQKHLRRYADWYTSRGYHVITFTFPMAEILSYQVGGKAEEHIDMLANHLAGWLEEEEGKNLVFHTFSNTGWLTYGVVLEKFQKQDQSLMGKIRGCIVDSAPVAAPDPRVWASGFSAALLKKQSIATKGSISSNGSGVGVMVGTQTIMDSIPAVTEAALLVILEKFFGVVLNLPKVNRRLSDVLGLLSVEQPKCPQLYIYSSADRVIPAESVESFIEKQRKSGREVRSCNFVSTPHVDHFRNDPNLYTSQLTDFLENCVLTCCKPAS